MIELNTQTYIAVLGLSLLSGITTLVGVFLAFVFVRSRQFVALGIGFSAGIMLLIAGLELIPESLNASDANTTLIAVLAGAGLIALLHYLIPHIHMVEEDGVFGRHMLRAAYLVALGLVLHDLPEGFAMANAYVRSPTLGILVAISIALHNIPEEFAMAVPAVALKRKRLLYMAAFFSAMAEPVGATLGLIAVEIDPSLNPVFMGFAAGAMIFVSLHELIPMVRIYGHKRLFLFGGVLSLFVYGSLVLLIPE